MSYMNLTLGDRHLVLAHHAQFSRSMHTSTLEKSNHRLWTNPEYSENSREHLDFEDGISGDDLARINAFEPRDRNLKPIGNQSGLWSAVKEGARNVRSAA